MKQFYGKSREALQILIEGMLLLLDFDIIQLRGSDELD